MNDKCFKCMRMAPPGARYDSRKTRGHGCVVHGAMLSARPWTFDVVPAKVSRAPSVWGKVSRAWHCVGVGITGTKCDGDAVSCVREHVTGMIMEVKLASCP